MNLENILRGERMSQEFIVVENIEIIEALYAKYLGANN